MADKIRSANPLMNPKGVLLGCHRGDRVHYPENTMEAFKAAAELGLDVIETDIRCTKDGVLVLIHDRDVARTTDGQGFVDEMTLAEIKALDAGSWKGAEFAGVKVPTVEEFLEYISKTDLAVNWELKEWPMDHGKERAFHTADLLLEMIERYGMAERSIINSFSEQVLEHVADSHPGRYMIHGYPRYVRPKDFASKPLFDFMDWAVIWDKGPDDPVGYKEDYEYALANGCSVCAMVPDTEECYQLAIQYGCKMFTSDDPAKATEVFKKLGYR